MPWGGAGFNYRTWKFCHNLTWLPLGASLFYKHILFYLLLIWRDVQCTCIWLYVTRLLYLKYVLLRILTNQLLYVLVIKLCYFEPLLYTDYREGNIVFLYIWIFMWQKNPDYLIKQLKVQVSYWRSASSVIIIRLELFPFLAHLHFSAEKLLLYPRRPHQGPHTKC